MPLRHRLTGGKRVWVNPRSDLPNNAAWYCGPRCASIAAIQFLDPTDTSPSAPKTGSFYDCAVTVSPVIGATLPEHEIPDTTASVAAGAIALEGYSTGPDEWEYVRFPPDSDWSNYNLGTNDSSYMAMLASKYAVGSIAGKDIFGAKTLQAEGTRPWIGMLLKIKWGYLIAILGVIVVVQLVMGLCAVAYANQVLCKDDSYLSTARLLRPVVERLGPSGCAMTGKDIANTLGEKVVYGVRRDKQRRRNHLDIGRDIRPRKHFPQGWYDGEIEVWNEEPQFGEGNDIEEEEGIFAVMRERSRESVVTRRKKVKVE